MDFPFIDWGRRSRLSSFTVGLHWPGPIKSRQALARQAASLLTSPVRYRQRDPRLGGHAKVTEPESTGAPSALLTTLEHSHIHNQSASQWPCHASEDTAPCANLSHMVPSDQRKQNCAPIFKHMGRTGIWEKHSTYTVKYLQQK